MLDLSTYRLGSTFRARGGELRVLVPRHLFDWNQRPVDQFPYLTASAGSSPLEGFNTHRQDGTRLSSSGAKSDTGDLVSFVSPGYPTHRNVYHHAR